MKPDDPIDAAELLGPIYEELSREDKWNAFWLASWEQEPDDAPFQDAAGHNRMQNTSYGFKGWG